MLYEVGVISLLAPNGRSRRRSPKPPFFGASSPFAEPGVLERVRGGEPTPAKKVPALPSPSVPADATATAAGTGFGAVGVPILVIIEVVGSISSADKNEVVCKSSRVDVVVRNVSSKVFCSARGAPLRSRIF